MAEQLTAINNFRPKIKHGLTVPLDELVNFIAMRTGVNEGPVTLMLRELRDALIFFHKVGRAVKIEGLGVYTPGISLDGKYRVSHRVDRALTNELNKEGGFRGELINRDNINKSIEDLVTMWNEANPDDLVVV